MSRWYLGIDTSNYRTSAAFFNAETREWHNSGRLLDVPVGKIGLRQSEALFQHTLHLHEMIGKLPDIPSREIRAICVSTRPRAVEGSYMPCFLAGENVARSIAHLLQIPLYPCSHQQGHLAAAALSANVLSWLREQEFYAWHLSGGTTELLHVRPGADRLPMAQRIGGTTDLAAGQLVDRAGALLGLSFPAGEALENLANHSDSVEYFCPKVKNCQFSLSGIENKVQDMYTRAEESENIAFFTLRTICAAVEKATEQARTEKRLPVLCAGGVMSNQMIQQRMSTQFGACFAEPKLSGDNAVGVAVLAAVQNGEQL